jgi:hypothetical protein
MHIEVGTRVMAGVGYFDLLRLGIPLADARALAVERREGIVESLSDGLGLPRRVAEVRFDGMGRPHRLPVSYLSAVTR